MLATRDQAPGGWVLATISEGLTDGPATVAAVADRGTKKSPERRKDRNGV